MSEINLDPIEEFLNARNLSALIERWLASIEADTLTLTNYRSRVVHFDKWWAAVGPGVEWRLTRSLLRAFEVYLRTVITEQFKTPMAYRSRYDVIRVIRSMFRWAANTGKTAKNYGEWLPWPAGDTPTRKAATPEQLARLMVAASESRMPLRDQTILAFFIGTGCRRTEVAGLRVEDLALLEDGSGTAKVIGKRTKANPRGERTIGFDAFTGKWLLRYMDAFGITSGPLWLNHDGESLSASGVYQMVKRVIKRAGLADQIHACHDLRRAFATIVGKMHPDSPMWADMIRRQLGHKHYSMTAYYTLLDADDIRERIVSPLDRGAGGEV